MKKINKHWSIVLICCLLAGASIGICVNAGGVFYTPVAESLGVMRGTFALNATFSLLSTSIVALFIPKLLQKMSLKTLLWIGILMAGVGTILMGFSYHVILFYILAVVRGIGAGLFSIVTLTMIINNWFVLKHGLATGIVLSFSGVVGAILSPILTSLIVSVGWQTTYIITGILLIIICLPSVLCHLTITPQEQGLLPYGATENYVSKKKDTGTRKSFVTVSFVFFFIFALLHPAISGITQHFPGYAESLGYGLTIGGTMLSAGMVGNILTKLVIGALSDRFGCIIATLIMIVVNIISIILLLNAISPSVMLIGAFLFGSIYSVGAVGFALLTKEFFGLDMYNTIYPIVSFGTTIGSAFALSLIGYVYDFTGSYNPAFYIALAIHAFAIIVVVSFYIKHKKELSHYKLYPLSRTR